MKMNNLLGVKMKTIVLGLIFLIPIFFIPLTIDPYVFNKQFLLFLVAPLLLLILQIKNIRDGKFTFEFSKSEIFLTLFLISYSLSVLFSSNPAYSVFGAYDNFTDSLVSQISFISFFAVLLFFLSNKKIESSELMKNVLYSLALAVLATALFSSFVIGDSIQFFTLTGGDARELILLLLFFIPLSLLFELNKKFSGKKSIFLRVAFFVSIFIFAIYAKNIHWTFLLIFILLILFFIEEQGLKVVKKYKKSLIGIFIILYFSLNIHSQISDINYFSPTLNLGSSVSIVKNSLKENFFWGIGPSLFDENFSKFRPKELNMSSYWDERFVKSSSFFFDVLNGSGMVTALTLIVFLFFVAWKSAKIIFSYKKSNSFEKQIPVFSSVSSIFFVFLILTSHLSFVLWLIFWVFSAIVFTQARVDEKKIILKPHQLLLSGLTGFLLLGWAVLSGFLIINLVADVYASTGLEQNLKKAVSINSFRHNYHITLSKLYLNKALTKVNSTEGLDFGEISRLLDKSKQSAQKAIEVAPNKVVSYETLGVMHRETIPYVSGSEALAIEAFLEAFKKEPTNPVLANELGKLYLSIFQNDKAIEYFKKSKNLKLDYYWSDFGLAKAYSQAGKHELALEIFDDIDGKISTPEYYFEFGKSLYQIGKISESINYFLKASELSPNYSNALYSLASAYEKNGQKEKAREYFVKVLDLNPTRMDLLNKVKEFEK